MVVSTGLNQIIAVVDGGLVFGLVEEYDDVTNNLAVYNLTVQTFPDLYPVVPFALITPADLEERV